MGDVDQPQRGIMFYQLAKIIKFKCLKVLIYYLLKQEQGYYSCHFWFWILESCSEKTDLSLFTNKQERFQTTV